MNIKNNKKKRIFIITIVFVAIVLIILICRLVSLRNNKVTPDKTGVAKPIYIKDDEIKLYPENIFAIVYRYKGDSDLVTIYNSLYKFKEFIELLSEYDTLKSDNEIQEFYSVNASNIKEYTGIKSIDEFKALLEETKKLSNSKKEFVKSSINMDSIVEDENGITCKLDIEYKDVTVSFKFIVLNSGTNSRNTYLYKAL